jgi:HAE1 family hydrophobic/amphiphilic exporter-1
MTMLALTLMVGIVIDDAIVVLENIYRFVEEKGMDPFQAAIEGTREIGLAVLATTLSLLAVFLPVGFMTGIVGRFMSSFGLTAAAAIAVSLIVSFTLTPMLAARWIKRPENEGEAASDAVGLSDAETVGHGDAEADYATDDDDDEIQNPKSEIQNSKAGWFYRKVDGGYTWLLKTAMRHRWAVVLICVITVASIVPLYKFVGMAFLPEEDESLFQINVRGPQGTSLSGTQSILDRIARDVRAEMPEVQNTLVLAGFGRGSGPNNGFVNVSLKPVSERSRGQAQLINQARNIVKKYSSKDYQVSVSASSSIAGSIGLGRGGSSVGVFIAGPDMIKLTEYANALVEKMKLEPDTFRDPDTSIEVGSPEIRVVIDRAKAADLGVRAGDVAQALNVLAAGQIVSTFSEGSKQYDVVVQADEQYRRDRSYLTQFSVSSSNTGRSQAQGGAVSGAGSGQVPAGTAVGTVPLDRVVRISEGLSPSSINRLNRLRQVTVSASLPPNSSEADAVAKIQDYAAQLQMPPEYITGVTGQSKELQKAYNAFLYAFLLSFVFMYLILAAQFESFIHPVTILLTLPLSVPFALLSTGDRGANAEHFLGARDPALIRHREEERDPADRSHEYTPLARHEPVRRDHPGEP